MKILLVDDNQKINETLKQFLEMKNFEVISCANGEKAIEFIDNNEFDLYILDIHLPKVGGLDIIKHIRKKNLNVPIIMITSSLEVENFVNAFENGANEYIKKPFHLEEMEIRINNLIQQNTPNLIKINDTFSFNFKNEELLQNNNIFPLRKKERKLLSILLKNKNNTLKKEQLISYIWENEKKENYPLRQLISALKSKIPFFKDKIQVITKFGYRLEL